MALLTAAVDSPGQIDSHPPSVIAVLHKVSIGLCRVFPVAVNAGYAGRALLRVRQGEPWAADMRSGAHAALPSNQADDFFADDVLVEPGTQSSFWKRLIPWK